MKILLVQPGFYNFKTNELVKKKNKKGFCPTYVLPYLASLMPRKADITLVDETINCIDFEGSYDLVGVSVSTPQAKRAYEIAQKFKDRKVPVLLGGYHINLCPEEAQNYSDAIIIGEAECVWEKLIRDFRAGKLKKRYMASERFNMKSLPFPRYDLLSWNLYQAFYGTHIPLETSRGCFNKCTFCSTPEVYKNGVFYRPISEVIEDIKRFQKDYRYIKNPIFIFVDDNLTANHIRARELFEALTPLRIRWTGYFTLKSGLNTALVKLARRSGCVYAFIGVESINPYSLKFANKESNATEEISQILHNFRDNRIIVEAGIILGFLEDKPYTFQQTVNFLITNAIPIAILNPLYPFPNTPLYNTFNQKDILYDKNFWRVIHNPYALFRNDNIEKDGFSLQELFEEAVNQLMSLKSIFQRTWPMKEFFLPLFVHNLVLRRILRKEGILAFV